jgi:hypothetical protein
LLPAEFRNNSASSYCRKSALKRWLSASCLLLVVTVTGCQLLNTSRNLGLPNQIIAERDYLVIHSDFRLPRKHRLFDELERLRDDLYRDLQLPTSDESVQLYLFAEPGDLRRYAGKVVPELRDRRAFFIKTDTRLQVFAHWGDKLAEDLRHETCHAFLHAVVADVPLWLDEGIAEYYEVEEHEQGLNRPHVFLLANAFRKGTWIPNLARLEMLTEPENVTQNDYAESWLWVHFLLQHDEMTRDLLRNSLVDGRFQGSSRSLSKELETKFPDAQLMLVEHLKQLSEGM